MYLGWYDDTPKKSTSLKIEEAVAAYVDRFKTAPNVVIVNEVDRVDVGGVTVRSETWMVRNNFWVGWEETAVQFTERLGYGPLFDLCLEESAS